MRNEIRFPALFRDDYQEYFKLRESIYLFSEGSKNHGGLLFKMKTRCSLMISCLSGIAQTLSDAHSRFEQCWLRVKESICVRVKMLFDLESQGCATAFVPSPPHITQSASACHYALQGLEKGEWGRKI